MKKVTVATIIACAIVFSAGFIAATRAADSLPPMPFLHAVSADCAAEARKWELQKALYDAPFDDNPSPDPTHCPPPTPPPTPTPQPGGAVEYDVAGRPIYEKNYELYYHVGDQCIDIGGGIISCTPKPQP